MLLALAAPIVDLSPIVTPLVQLGGLLLTGLASWATLRFSQYLHLSSNNAAMQQLLGAVDRGISYGQQVAQAQATTIANTDVNAYLKSETQRQAVNYVVTKLPDTLKRLNMTPQHVSDLVLAKLPQS
jgi:hypothetical protein